MHTTPGRNFFQKLVVLIALSNCALLPLAKAEEPLKTLIWTTDGATSSAYAQAVAIGNVLREKQGSNLLVLPNDDTTARLSALKNGNAGYCACSINSYFSQEGVLEFATPQWGPQPVRAILASQSSFGVGLAVARNSGVKSLLELKDKRVAWIRNNDSYNLSTTAFLAYAGLSWDHVRKIAFPNYKLAINGVINGHVDAAYASSTTSDIKRLADSPRGLIWPGLPAQNIADWDRMQEVLPYFSPVTVTSGAGITPKAPWAAAGFPYPILVTDSKQSAKEVYDLTKSLVENFDDYKDAASGASGWKIDLQNFKWIMPYHEGAVTYFKEIGVWSDAKQAHQDLLLKRQEVLATAFSAYKATNPPKEEFKAGWVITRAEALADAGLHVNFY